jgi:mono/diheme cytochrome c family protein
MMTIGTRLALVLASIYMASFVSFSWAQVQEAPKGEPARGKQLWLTDGCSYCHGTVGQGGGGRAAGLRVAGQPIPFAAFLNQVRQPANEMPVYVEKVLPDQDVADIFAYIRSLPAPRDLKSIPILN